MSRAKLIKSKMGVDYPTTEAGKAGGGGMVHRWGASEVFLTTTWSILYMYDKHASGLSAVQVLHTRFKKNE